MHNVYINIRKMMVFRDNRFHHFEMDAIRGCNYLNYDLFNSNTLLLQVL